MRSFTFLASVLAVSLAACQSGPERAIKRAATVLGVNAIKTLEIKASGVSFTVGQNFTANDPWPPVTIKTYRALIKLCTPKSLR